MHNISVKLAAATWAMAAATALAQADVSAQQAFDREVAACNNANLPAPSRDACVRAAGAALDRSRGGPPVGVPLTTPDGRATVIAPEGSTPPLGDQPPASVAPPPGSQGVATTPDGRATVVKP